MNTSVTTTRIGNLSVNLSPETGQLLALGKRNRWPFRVLGRAPMLHESVRLGDWLLVPAQADSSPIPERALARIQAIFAAGVRPKGFVLVHEAPKLLKAPREPRKDPESAWPNPSTAMPQSVLDVATALGKGIAALASTVLPMLFLFAAAAIADPILVAITEDNYWVEIDRWDTE